ncbi:hypothetical protein D917_07391 [Trichinella nativa]|uniref:Uncharacterized protein n=1 Tax=Trichinella nativa TaxID=6335 RepID=A0A1Y3ESJ8_9BILA|nr:hypothetical protein D917_07391 [Trichinella nativa]
MFVYLERYTIQVLVYSEASPYSVPGAAAWVTDCSQNRESVSLSIQRVNHSCRLMIDCAKGWDGWSVSCGGSSFFAFQTEPALTRSLTSNKATSRLVTTIYLSISTSELFYFFYPYFFLIWYL